MRLPWLSRPRRVRYKPLIDIPFIGRDAILADLRQHAESVKAGQSRFVAIEGPAGSGKSALLSELVYLLGQSPDVLTTRIQTGVGCMEAEFYVNLFDALQSVCDRMLDKIYNDTKRFRKLISEEWDEQAFKSFLMSVDWSHYQPEAMPSRPVRGPTQGDPMRQLLGVVSQYPWAIATAAALAYLSGPLPSGEDHQLWSKHCESLLKLLAVSPKQPASMFVLMIDHLDQVATDRSMPERWLHHWASFVAAVQESGLPMLLIWSGSHETLRSLKDALAGTNTLQVLQLGALEDGEVQALNQRLQRALPRAMQRQWLSEAQNVLNSSRLPGDMILSALQMAVSTDAHSRPPLALPISEQAVADACVHHLVHRLRSAHAENDALFNNLLAIFAFWSAGMDFSLDDILPYVDIVAADLDPYTARAMLERMLGACVRYGLLKHDVYRAKFTTVSSQIQHALRGVIEPDPERRQDLVARRRLAALTINCLRRGQEGLLEVLAAQIESACQEDNAELTAYLTTPLRRMLLQISKDEKYHMARALGKFPSRLAVTLLTTMLDDEDEQLRSRVAQSLADLNHLDLETYPTLLKATRDYNSDVRWIAAMALGKKKHQQVVEVLINLLTDEDKEVGRIAAQGLGEQGDVRAVTHLIEATQDRYPLLRGSAAVALGQLADRRALPALQSLCQDDNRLVRQSAELAMVRLAQHEA